MSNFFKTHILVRSNNPEHEELGLKPQNEEEIPVSALIDLKEVHCIRQSIDEDLEIEENVTIIYMKNGDSFVSTHDYEHVEELLINLK